MITMTTLTTTTTTTKKIMIATIGVIRGTTCTSTCCRSTQTLFTTRTVSSCASDLDKDTGATKTNARTYGRVVVSGVQPSGIPHIGNYFGALRNWVALQDSEPSDTPLLYSVADLHALTVPRSAAAQHEATLATAASLLALGIDPERATLFRQSRVPQHTQLAWLLACHTPVAWLARMTQWRTKLAAMTPSSTSTHLNATLGTATHEATTTEQTLDSAAATLRMGLFAYPLLQAADILIYRGTVVPVGSDQQQHIELANTVARQFNRAVASAASQGEKGKKIVFPSVRAELSSDAAAQRVMSLADPLRKMAKSDAKPHARIDIGDDPEVIVAKIRRAVTDSERDVAYDPERRPGVANLVRLYALATDVAVEEAARSFEGQSCTDLKREVADALAARFAPARTRLRDLLANKDHLDVILRKGESRARQIAQKTLDDASNALGL